MKANLYIPHPALQDYVLSISTVSALLPEGINEVITPYPPTPFQSLIFYCNHPISMGRAVDANFQKQPFAVLIGPQYSRVNIKVHKQLSAVRVDFLPGGMYRMLGIPMYELFDDGFDALDFFGEKIKTLNGQLRNTPNLVACKKIVEKFLLDQVSKLKELLPVDSALQMLLKHNGHMPVSQTASFSCLSLKQFERKCKERIGMNPKMFARILKFSKAYRLHESCPQLSWTQIAYEAKYYDQMHMIRDFKTFAGVNPSVIEKQLLSTPLRMQKDLSY
ncbi:MAG: helix-turn-helix domain-containing protein [Maribacter sp.]|nr:helix-turn-helix domain-containing protein [Maribacter sp.]